MTAYEDMEISKDLARQMEPARPEDHWPPDVPFGSRPTQVYPHDWASWILTNMREDELAGRKPKPFSAWAAAVVMAKL